MVVLNAARLASSLLGQEVPLGSDPPGRVSLGFTRAPPGTRKVLLIGARLPEKDRAELRRRGCSLEVVPTFEAALERMEHEQYEVVVTAARVSGDADGLRFVRGFKHAASRDFEGAEAMLMTAYARVPFLVLPLEGTTEYALFQTLRRWYLGNAESTPLFEAILFSKLVF